MIWNKISETDYSGYEARYPEVKIEFDTAQTSADISRLKKMYVNLIDNDQTNLVDGALNFFIAQAKERITPEAPGRSMEDARVDMILNTTDSDGRRTPRRWS